MVLNRFLILFVMVILVPACKIDRNKSVDRDKFTFKMSDDSFLFFKNVRQIYYDFQDLSKAKWQAFRFGARYQSISRPVITPVIVVDWMKNESYLLVEPNEVLLSEKALIIREKNSKGKLFEYSLKEKGRENMLEFATKIYEGIMDGNEIYVQSNQKFLPLFINDDDRENFRIVMSDYYRLTRIF
jgi:hypothetical protein